MKQNPKIFLGVDAGGSMIAAEVSVRVAKVAIKVGDSHLVVDVDPRAAIFTTFGSVFSPSTVGHFALEMGQTWIPRAVCEKWGNQARFKPRPLLQVIDDYSETSMTASEKAALKAAVIKAYPVLAEDKAA